MPTPAEEQAVAAATQAAATAVAALQGENLAAFNQALKIIKDNQPSAARGNNRPSPKGIPCSNYQIGQDYQVWRTHFRDNVRAVHSITANDDTLNDLCLQWVSTKLDPGPTRAVYDNLPAAKKTSWKELDAALTAAFVDDRERLNFLSRMDAHQRLPGMSLRLYKDTLLQKMNSYQPELRTVPAEWERSAVQRFREGLNNPMMSAHIMMNAVGTSATLEHAFQFATNFENTMAHLDQKGITNAPTMSAMLGVPTAAVRSGPATAPSNSMPTMAGLLQNGEDQTFLSLFVKM